MRLTLLLSIILLFPSCIKGKEQASTEQKQSAVACDTSAYFRYMELFVPSEILWNSYTNDKGESRYRYTFENTTDVYCSPTADALVVGTLTPFSSITLEREGVDPETQVKWYKIKYCTSPQGGMQNGIGYIKDGNLDFGNTYEGFILGKSALLDTVYEQPSHRFKVIYDSLSIDVNLLGIDYYNHFILESIRTALKGEPSIAKLYWHHGESCPESEGNVFITKSGNKLIELAQGSGSGEAGYEYYTKVYFPVKLNNGKTLLIENANVEHMFNPWNQTFNTFDYPADCGIPINELIVVKEQDDECKYDEEKGSCMEDKDGNPIMETTHKVVRYYRWDGTNIKLAKEIIYKKRKEDNAEN